MCRKVSNNPERFEKKIGSKTVKWCSKCGNRSTPGRWTTSHYSDEHVPRTKSGNDKIKTANLAKDDEPTSQAVPPPTENKVSWSDALAKAADRH